MFRLLVECVQDYAIFMLDPAGRVASWNLGAQRIKGYQADEIIGKHFSIFYSPEDIRADKPARELIVAAREGRFEDEGWRLRKNGTCFWANVVITALHDQEGRLKGFAKVSRDITDRANMERALRGRAQILDLVSDYIFLRDLEDRITYWNRGAQRIFGWTQAEVLGRVTHDLLHTRFPKPLEEIKEDLYAQGHWEGELEHIRSDGTGLTAASRWTLQRDPEGKPIGIIEMNFDLTERKRIEQALRDKNIELQNAAESKNRFLANMSHELRTPLNGIIGFAEFLSDGKPGPLNPKQKEYLHDILSGGRHLLQLINDILDLAKVEANKMDLRPEKFSLVKAIEGVCAVSKPIAQKKNIEIEVKVAPTLAVVCLDPQKFKQVLYNLISNAVKFTDEAGRIEIRAIPKADERFEISVKDSGIGIEAKDLPRLFTEFEQLDSGADRRYEGTGLGLALTRKIVELQGGAIEVESEPGKGSTFRVNLPLEARVA
jgi:PAS domain S-box-containing protein